MNKKYLIILSILCAFSFLWFAGCGGGGGVGGGITSAPGTGSGSGGTGSGSPGSGTPTPTPTPTPGGSQVTPTSGNTDITITLPTNQSNGGVTIPIGNGSTTYVSFDNAEPADIFTGPTPNPANEPFQVFISPDNGEYIEDSQTLVFHSNRAARIFYSFNGGSTQQTPLLDPTVFTERNQNNGYALKIPLRSGGTSTLVVSFFGIDTRLNRTSTRVVTLKYSSVEQLLSDAIGASPVADILDSDHPPLRATLDFDVTVTSLNGTTTQTKVNVPVLLNTIQPVSGFTQFVIGN